MGGIERQGDPSPVGYEFGQEELRKVLELPAGGRNQSVKPNLGNEEAIGLPGEELSDFPRGRLLAVGVGCDAGEPLANQCGPCEVRCSRYVTEMASCAQSCDRRS